MTENSFDAPVNSPAPSNNPPDLAPIAASKRIDAMDILRGFALIGILLMNIEWFGRSAAYIGSFDNDLTGLDHAVEWLVRCFVEGKFYKLFALLFGMGFAVMLIRAREVGKPFGAWFTRRMVVLFLFGMLHSIFIWPGDILHDYAFAGLLFVGWMFLFRIRFLRKFDNINTFLRIGLVWMCLPFVAGAIAGLVFGVRFDYVQLTEHWQEEQHIAALVDQRMELPVDESEIETDTAGQTTDDASDEAEEEDRELTKEEEIEQAVSERVEDKRERDADAQEEIEAYTQVSYWRATQYRFSEGLSNLRFTPMFSMLILMPVFLIGYWFVASGTLRNHEAHRHIFKPMAIVGMGFGLFFSVGGLVILQHPTADIAGVLQAAGSMMFVFGQYVLCAGYVGVIVLLLGSPKLLRPLSRLAPMGRMALTNYIMQTAILSVIFHSYAGGLWGEIARAPQMLIVIAILIFQGYFSAWWLRKYRFGPLEWLWRSLTYMSVQPMRIAGQP